MVHFVSETAQVELEKWTSVSPCRVADELRPLRDMSTGRCASDFVAWRVSPYNGHLAPL